MAPLDSTQLSHTTHGLNWLRTWRHLLAYWHSVPHLRPPSECKPALPPPLAQMENLPPALLPTDPQIKKYEVERTSNKSTYW